MESIPNIKAGPALLQNPNILSASLLDKIFISWLWETHCAPIGYPPRRPINRMDSEPFGILQNLPSGRNSFNSFCAIAPFKYVQMTKKGKREGITTCTHNAIPAFAAVAISLLMVIIVIKTAANSRAVINFFKFFKQYHPLETIAL